MFVTFDENRSQHMAPAPQFEYPTRLRELAQKNMEQVQAACGQFMDAARRAQGMIGISADPTTAGLKQIQERTLLITEQNMKASFALANELAKAKNFKEMLEIQSCHAQLQMVTYATQAKELGRLMADTEKGQPRA
jgi:phasin